MSRSNRRGALAVLMAGIIGQAAFAAEPMVLQNATWAVTIRPETLQVVARPADGGEMVISGGRSEPLDVAMLQQQGQSASWRMPSAAVNVSMTLAKSVLEVQFSSSRPGKFAWPEFVPAAGVAGYVLPMFEGLYIPAGSASHIAFLVEHGPMNTTADLSMPFVGIDYKRHCLTYILTNQFNNELTFREDGKRLAARLVHEVTRNHKVGEWGVRVCLGAASPVEPAREFRRWLLETRQFVSMREKIEQTPEAAKLAGAAHVYLWGSGSISRYDVSDWKAFARQLHEQAEAGGGSIGARLWELMSPEVREMVAKLPSAQWVDEYTTGRIAEELSRLLERSDLQAGPKRKTRRSSNSDPSGNCAALYAAFTSLLKPVETWGDGISVKMLYAFADNGFDRLWLGVDGYRSLRLHPEVVKEAKRLGYLVGPYDSYHSIHSPDEADTWESAQFGAELYKTGAVVGADGKKRRGFKQKGYILSAIAARPYVEKRVSSLMREMSPNSLFVDCDAFGELFDDYSAAHPATQEQDMRARLERMAWIRDEFHVVIGSEGGSAYAASTIHFAHGMMTPGFGWGDPDMKDRKSPYYLGAYYPPDGPAVFFKSVAIKDKYRDFYFDPRYRLPLYETVFHDSVVATHQWGFGSLKFKDLVRTRELLELLYGVPPLYHMNMQEFAERKDEIKEHYAVFSPLHRQIALLSMTSFEWLSQDRLVQRTVFADRVGVVANFGGTTITYKGHSVPAQSVSIANLENAETTVYTPW